MAEIKREIFLFKKRFFVSIIKCRLEQTNFTVNFFSTLYRLLKNIRPFVIFSSIIFLFFCLQNFIIFFYEYNLSYFILFLRLKPLTFLIKNYSSKRFLRIAFTQIRNNKKIILATNRRYFFKYFRKVLIFSWLKLFDGTIKFYCLTPIIIFTKRSKYSKNEIFISFFKQAYRLNYKIDKNKKKIKETRNFKKFSWRIFYLKKKNYSRQKM